MLPPMREWFDELITEMIEAGLVVEVEPGVVQKTGGHGMKLDYNSFKTQITHLSEKDKDEFKIVLLAIMEDPKTMGTPLEPGSWN